MFSQSLDVVTAYLLLGGNIGNRENYLLKATNQINSRAGVIELYSSIYETESWGYKDNPFLNQVIKLRTKKFPKELLLDILAIESKFGRIRKLNTYHERVIDIDILFYDNLCIKTQNLIIPHPRIQDRKFALIPMVEVANNLVHPILHKTMGTLLNECEDQLSVEYYKKGR